MYSEVESPPGLRAHKAFHIQPGRSLRLLPPLHKRRMKEFMITTGWSKDVDVQVFNPFAAEEGPLESSQPGSPQAAHDTTSQVSLIIQWIIFAWCSAWKSNDLLLPAHVNCIELNRPFPPFTPEVESPIFVHTFMKFCWLTWHAGSSMQMLPLLQWACKCMPFHITMSNHFSRRTHSGTHGRSRRRAT